MFIIKKATWYSYDPPQDRTPLPRRDNDEGWSMKTAICSQCNGSGRERYGTIIGPVDPGFDWLSGFGNHCASDETKKEYAVKAKELMLSIKAGDIISTGDYSYKVYEVGMYDGWPFWKPTPAVIREGTLGPERTFFYEIKSIHHPLSPTPSGEANSGGNGGN